MRVRHLCIAVLIAASVLPAAWAAEFRSVETPAVLYDAPSARSKKLYVMGGGYPVEVIVTVEGWHKIRDASGELSWIETKNLSARRTVMVKSKVADIRQTPEDTARLAFQAEQNVLLDLVELTGTGWARVTHRDGQTGYVRLAQVWGV
jgi:SH3-like domain-containing protein